MEYTLKIVERGIVPQRQRPEEAGQRQSCEQDSMTDERESNETHAGCCDSDEEEQWDSQWIHRGAVAPKDVEGNGHSADAAELLD